MSIIIQFNSSAFAQSAVAVPSSNRCPLKRNVKLEMVPGIEHSDVPGMTDDESSIDVSNSIYSTTLKEVRITNNHLGSCFGLPYQDHNYGAPPPPTPPSCTPCASPIPSVPVQDEDTTLSVISNSTNEEVQEESVTRCICGFEHDDEYMICCDNCLVWQHVDCMGLDRNNIPETYLCEECEPRKLDRHKAKLLQSRKKNSLTAVKPSASTSFKHETTFSNRFFGKDFKKKSIGQSTEDWLTSNKGELQNISAHRFNNYSSDSDDCGLNKNLERRHPKTRSKRRRKKEEKAGEVFDQTSKRKTKEHGKERMEAKRSKLRRGKKKESTSTADEEAQDAWEYSLEWCEKNFEDAINNQYTPEIQHLARTLSTQGYEKGFLEQMRTKQCHAYDDGKRKQLVCLRDLPRNSPLIEYKGKFLMASQFHDIHPLYNKRLYPYVLFYVLDQDEICVDASMYGNDARFVRRSCKPNARIRHMVYNGKLHLYLTSTKVIFREDEVTIPLIIHPNDSIKDFECACGTDECLMKPKKKNGTIEVCHDKRRRTRRSTMTADEDSNPSMDLKILKPQTHSADIKPNKHSMPSVDVKPTRQNHSVDSKPTRQQTHSVDSKPTRQQTHFVDSKPTRQQTHSVDSKPTRQQTHSVDSKPTRQQTHSVDSKPTRQQTHSVDSKPTRQPTHSVDVKATRQQTKLNYCEKPKQVTIKSEPVESQVTLSEYTSTNIKEDLETKSTSDYEFEESTSSGKKKQTREERKLDAIMRAFRQMEQAEKRKQLALEKQKSHHPKMEIPEEKIDLEPKSEDKIPSPVNDNVCKEEEKAAPQTPKSKKGKRRRGSGTPSRRRTRTNSGGSDLMSLEEASPSKILPSTDMSSFCPENTNQASSSSPPPTSLSGLISPVPTVTPVSPHVLKTKRSLMNEWLQEKSEAVSSTPVSSPLPIHTEMKWNMSAAVATCYVRCTKDAPHSSGISAAHLRRSNSAGHMKPTTGQGSAKKRWLRQAMYDCHGCEIQPRSDSCSIDSATILDNGCLSPNSHGDLDSLNGVGEDVLTPLKKRRLMRESIESLPSPQSPSTATSLDDTDNTTVSNSLISDNSTEHGVEINENEISLIEKGQPLTISPEDAENSNHPMSDTLIEGRKSNENLAAEKESKICNETFFTPISTLELIPDEYNKGLSEKSCKNNLLTSLNKNDKSEIVLESAKQSDASENSNSENGNSVLNTILKETSPEENENASLSIDMDVCEDEPNEKDLNVQEQLQNKNIIKTISVNKEAPIDMNCTLPVNNHTSSSKTILNSCDLKNESSMNCDGSESKLNSVPRQDATETIFPCEDVESKNCFISDANCVKVNLPESEQSLTIPENVEKDNSEQLLNHTIVALNVASSCNSIDNDSNASIQLSDCKVSVKVDIPDVLEKISSEITVNKKLCEEEMELDNLELAKATSKILEAESKPASESRCILNEESNLNSLLQSKETVCASATQKRKVSLSEYRMRMRESTAKVRPAAESTNKNSSVTSICAISLPDTLPEQVTLAPLPLFEKARAQKHLSKQPTQLIANKRKKEVDNDDQDKEDTEHRENLNERLKREFGFDVSEGTTNNISLKSKISNISNSEAIKLLGARPSPPPPPPPPRLTRPPQQESMAIAIPPTQFSFPPSHFPRPQFMVPQVPGAPYIPAQSPILPAVHPMNTNPSQCSLRSPLLPSTHPFTPSITLLRPPPQHDFTPVNAQRFVQQPPPPPPHKSYLHIYPSRLYK